MKDLLYQYNPWWEQTFKNKDVKPREKLLIDSVEMLDRLNEI